jgi:hypothetical protein
VRFEFRLVGSGWAEATTSDGHTEVVITASYLTDALGDLLHAVWRVVEGDAEARCSWEDEPGEARWILIREEQSAWLRILQFSDAYPSPPDESGVVVFETRSDLKTLARGIALGASRSLDEYGEAGYRRRWVNAPFPTATLRLIQSKL